MSLTLKAGAGQAVIRYTDEMLPNFGENYTCIHDDSYVQVLLIECGSCAAIVAVGSVGAAEPHMIRKEVSAVLGISEHNVAVTAKHVLSAPHASRKDDAEHVKERASHMGKTVTDEEAEIYANRNLMMSNAQLEAAIEAAKKAKAGLRDAVMRFAYGHTDVVCNRLVKTNQGWWQGHNPDIPADGSLPVLRFDDINGHPIAILFGCNCAPGVLENSFLSDGGRAISGDLAAYTERKLEKQYGPDTVAIYGIGASGDQWQALRALHDEIDKEGNQTVTDLHEAGFALLDIMSGRLSESVTKAAEKAESVNIDTRIRFDTFEFMYPGQKINRDGHRPPSPLQKCEYIPAGENRLGFNIISLGDLAILMTGVEMGSRSWKKIRDTSPFRAMMLLEFSDDLGGGYLLEKDYYEMVTYQSQKTRFFAGTAEKYSDDIIDALNSIWNTKTKGEENE